jgi:phenylpyruvate tautomerase PptA (4-oxalocrotonate tautomerase family)
MPIIEFKAFEHRLADEQKTTALIRRLTDAVRETYGDDVAHQTQVILYAIPPALWGIDGAPAG